MMNAPAPAAEVGAASSGSGRGRSRIAALDVLRGAVMVLMVLDHARDFFWGFQRPSPTDLATTTPTLFFTRWVTHFCASVFVFLAGTSAYLYGQRHTRQELSTFLRVRGGLLVFLELTIVHFCWIPDPFFRFNVLQVIWVLGSCMLLLSLLVRLPFAALGTLGAAILLLHDTLSGLHSAQMGGLSWLWTVGFEPGRLEPVPGHRFMVAYVIVPWLGVMLLGYCFGRILSLAPALRWRRIRDLGIAATLAFIALRAVNGYGDPAPWPAQSSPLFSVMSFLNCEKYPPSLDYSLMTLGPALIALGLLDRQAALGSAGRVLRVFGGVPLFFYVAHLALLRVAAAPIAFARFGAAGFRPPPGHLGSPELGLWAAYLAWLAAVLLLYPLCAWFLRKKEANPGGMLRFF